MKKLDKNAKNSVVTQCTTFLIMLVFAISMHGCNPSKGNEESSQTDQGSSQEPDPRILENRRELRNYILSCNVPQAIPTKPLSMDLEETIAEPDENGIYHPCHYETWSEVTDLHEIVSINPNNNVIWPGAVVQGKTFVNGSPALINMPRKPGKITVSGLVFDDNLPNSLVVENPSEGNVKQVISNLIRRPVISTEGSYYYTSHQTYSAEHSLQSIGLSSSWMWGELSSQVNSLDYKQRNNFVVKLTQKYYSVSFEDPSTPDAVFSDSVEIDNAKLYMQSGNPPALITNVNYGRIIILSFSTTQDSEVFKAALDASFNSWGATGSVNLESEHSEILSSSEIQIFAIGGSSEKIAKIITGEEGKSKIDVLREYIDHGGNFSLYSPGSPIGYKANYLSNNGVAAISSSTKFKKLVRCDYVPYRKPLHVTVDKLLIFDVEDDDEDMDFGYEIQFLGLDDKIVDKFANSAFDIYVEEPTKVGEKEGKNIFFQGQTKTVNAPILKVKCIVWARSRDGDSERPWKHGARQERTYELAEFVNPPAFVPWNSMRLSISIQ